QQVEASGVLGKSLCKPKKFEDRELMTLDYQRMTAVLWQADLDFSQNTRGANTYGLVVTDVFTREVATKALPDKRAETVTRAAAEIIPELVEEEGDYVVTTDMGNEFRALEAALPGRRGAPKEGDGSEKRCRPRLSGSTSITGPHQCPEAIPAPARGGAGGFELRFDDGASHGWLGCALGAPWLRPTATP
ncbi:unnamed protein product, partial [Symbiodinium microadriaticum]